MDSVRNIDTGTNSIYPITGETTIVGTQNNTFNNSQIETPNYNNNSYLTHRSNHLQAVKQLRSNQRRDRIQSSTIRVDEQLN